MTIDAVIFWFVIGGIAGSFVGGIVLDFDFGVAGDFVIGGAGGVIGGWFLPTVGIEIGPGALPELINATAGGATILAIVVQEEVSPILNSAVAAHTKSRELLRGGT